MRENLLERLARANTQQSLYFGVGRPGKRRCFFCRLRRAKQEQPKESYYPVLQMLVQFFPFREALALPEVSLGAVAEEILRVSGTFRKLQRQELLQTFLRAVPIEDLGTRYFAPRQRCDRGWYTLLGLRIGRDQELTSTQHCTVRDAWDDESKSLAGEVYRCEMVCIPNLGSIQNLSRLASLDVPPLDTPAMLLVLSVVWTRVRWLFYVQMCMFLFLVILPMGFFRLGGEHARKGATGGVVLRPRLAAARGDVPPPLLGVHPDAKRFHRVLV
jgi:hypothetical protein